MVSFLAPPPIVMSYRSVSSLNPSLCSRTRPPTAPKASSSNASFDAPPRTITRTGTSRGRTTRRVLAPPPIDTGTVPTGGGNMSTRPAAPPPMRNAKSSTPCRSASTVAAPPPTSTKVGEALGTGAASLYWHVRSKDELLQLVFEQVTREVTLPSPDPARWKEQLRDLMREMRATMHRHPGVARISLGRIPAGPTLARFTEWLFELLRPVGIPDRVIAFVGDLAGLYVGAYAFEESLGMSSPTGEDLSPQEIVEMFKDYMSSLPEERFPHTRGAIDLLFGGDPDERFEFGTDLIIRGLETYASEAAGSGAETSN